MKSIAAAHVIRGPQLFVRLLHRGDHRSVHVGEPLAVLRSKLFVDVAQMGEIVVVGHVRRLLPHLLPRPKEVGVNCTGGADHDLLHSHTIEL